MGLVVVSGAIANKLQQGGEAWVRLSYLLALRRLGHSVWFLEQIPRSACVDAQGVATTFESSANRAYFLAVMDRFGLADCATLIATDEHGWATIDPALVDLAQSADALLNISGHLALDPLLARFRRKVFLDIDPGYTQFWHAAGNAGARLAGHDHFFTIAENIRQGDCSIPPANIPWRTTRPPVVLDQWPVTPAAAPRRFTTIANWRGAYGGVQFAGRTYGQKAHEFRKLLSLPEHVPATFEIALNIHPGDHKDLAALESSGWRITDPAVAATPDSFRRYVQESAAEFSVAQGIYVETNSGWFSDRTVRYLASGKPVLVQETGFSQHMVTGRGLIPFRTLDEAIAGANAIAAEYELHCQAARAIAEQYFDADKVLVRLLEEIGVSP